MAGEVALRSPAGRAALAATVLGSGMAFLDGTVVNIALPSIGDDLDAGLTGLQWTVNGYALTLAGLLLVGGSLGDRLGRRRAFLWGVAWFAVASLLCAVAPTIGTLVAARALQGVGAALLTPGSLALIEATFREDDRGAAIGAWSGLSGASTALGPFLGGWLVEAVSWRLIFLVNLPLAALVWWASRRVPESRDLRAARAPLDVTGAALAALGLAGVTYALTEGPSSGWGGAAVVAPGVAGVAALGAFVGVQMRRSHPMVPPSLFASRAFTAANLVTFLVYAALAGALFLLPIQLQTVSGYTPFEAGVALLPMTVLMLLLSARAGRIAQRIGPRLPMGIGPIVAGGGLAMLVRVGEDAPYAADVLPAVLVFGIGMSITVAPLTATVLAAAGPERAGIASAVNTAVARAAGLLAVAVVPLAAGIATDGALQASAFDDGFHRAALVCGAVCALGGALSFAAIGGCERPPAAPEPPPAHCCVAGPPPEGAPAGAPRIPHP
ncbi:MAG: MFS transporter [Thermoleophilia bacterium]